MKHYLHEDHSSQDPQQWHRTVLSLCTLVARRGCVRPLSRINQSSPPPIYILSITVSHQWASFQKLTGQILSGQNMEWETGSDDNTCP